MSKDSLGTSYRGQSPCVDTTIEEVLRLDQTQGSMTSAEQKAARNYLAECAPELARQLRAERERVRELEVVGMKVRAYIEQAHIRIRSYAPHSPMTGELPKGWTVALGTLEDAIRALNPRDRP